MEEASIFWNGKGEKNAENVVSLVREMNIIIYIEIDLLKDEDGWIHDGISDFL